MFRYFHRPVGAAMANEEEQKYSFLKCLRHFNPIFRANWKDGITVNDDDEKL